MGQPCPRRRTGRADRRRRGCGGARCDLRREQFGLRRLQWLEPGGSRVHLGHGGPDDNRPERDNALQRRRLHLRRRFGLGHNNRYRCGGNVGPVGGRRWRVGGRRDSERRRRVGDSHRRHIRPGRCLWRRTVERRRAGHRECFGRFQRRTVGGHIGHRRGGHRRGCRRRDHSSCRRSVGNGRHIDRRWNRRPGGRLVGGPGRHSRRRHSHGSRTGGGGLSPDLRRVTRAAASRAVPGGRP